MKRKQFEKPKKKAESAPTVIAARAPVPPTIYPPGSVHEKRQQIADQVFLLRGEIRTCSHCADLREKINKLVEESERLLIPAVEETESSEGRPTIRRVAQKDLVEANAEVSTPKPVQRHTRVQKGKRKCSLCHEPGHQARTCPNAHVVQKQKKAVAAKQDERASRATTLAPGKRACSICRKPGHRAQNCPERD